VLPADATIQHLRVRSGDGASIYGRLTTRPGARGPVVLILDGIGCTGWAFQRIIPTVAARHPVLLMHYRGHGESPLPPRPWRIGMDALADDAAALLDAAQVEAAVVLGFSMGFQVALELVRRHRARVRALVGLCGTAGHVLSSFQGTGAVANALPAALAVVRNAREATARLWRRVVPSELSRTFGLWTQVNVDRIDLPGFEFYMSQMAELSPELFVEMLAQAQRHTAVDVLPEVDVPALIVAGGRDRFVPAEVSRRTAFALPDMQWWLLPDATHALPGEYPHEVAQRLLEFIETLQERARRSGRDLADAQLADVGVAAAAAATR
jgi:pimeloyl-ACP methyl ester carboxylesterase